MAFKLNGIQLKGGGDKKKTKYVTDKNSPDLKNYNDSLSAYNSVRPEYEQYKDRWEATNKMWAERLKVEGSAKGPADAKKRIAARLGKAKEAREMKYDTYIKNETMSFDNPKVKAGMHGFDPQGYVDSYVGHAIEKSKLKNVYKKPNQKVKYADPKIVEKQKTLQKAGLYKGELDGIMGSKSKAALKTYESSMAKTASKAKPKPKPKPVPKNKPGQYTKSSQYPGVKNVYDMKTKKIVGMQNKDGKQIPLGGNFTKDWQYPK